MRDADGSERFPVAGAGLFRPVRRRVALGLGFLVAAACFAAGMTFPNPTPQFDEFFHLLVANSLRAGEGFRITPEAEPYDRAWLFSYAVYLSQELFGPTVVAARVPSALCWALTLGGVACWLARRVGLAAAAVTACLLGFSVHALMYATMVRFYTPQALFIWIAAACVEAAVPRLRPAQPRAASAGESRYDALPRRLERRAHTPDGRRGGGGCLRAGLYAAAGTLAAGVAFSLQPTTLIAAVAAGLWVLGVWFWFLARSPAAPARRVAAAAGTVVLAVAGAAGLWVFLVADYFEEVTAGTRVWAADDADDASFYQRMLLLWYAPLWGLLPLWAAAGVIRGGPQAGRRRRAVAFLLVLGLLPVLILSVLPTKAFRYIFFALPFVFAVAGIGVAEALRGVLGSVSRLATGRTAPTRVAIGVLAVAFVLASAAYAVRRSPGLTRGVATATGWSDRAPYDRSDWERALPVLRPAAARAKVVVSSAGTKALYWLGRLDLNLSETLRLDRDPGWIQPQDGRPVITTAAELAALREAYPSGLIVVELPHWRDEAFVGHGAADELERGFAPLPLDPALELLAFTWGDAAGPAASP